MLLLRPNYSARQQLANILNDGNTAAWYEPPGLTGNLGASDVTNASKWANSTRIITTALTNGDLLQATGANQPIIPSKDYTPKAWLSGVSGNSITTPSSSASNVTGDMAIVCYISLNDWNIASQKTIFSKWNSVAGGRSYLFAIGTGGAGLLRLFSSVDGTASTSADSSSATGFSSGSFNYIAVSRVQSSGAVKFFTSSDGLSWTQLGITKTSGAGNATFAGTGLPTVGAHDNGSSSNMLGNSVSVKLFNGIPPMLGGSGSSSPVVSFDANDSSETSTNGATWVSSATGETWTLNNTGATPAQICRTPSLLCDGTAHFLKAAGFTLIQPETVYMVGRQVSWTGTHALFDGNTLATGELIQTTATPQLNITAGSSVAANTNLAVGAYGVIQAVFNGASSSLNIDSNAATTGNAGAGNMSGYTVGANGGNLLFGNLQVKESIIRKVADSATVQSQIQSLLKSIHGTP